MKLVLKCKILLFPAFNRQLCVLICNENLCVGVIEYLSNGRVAINHEDFKANVYDQCLKKMNNGDKDYVYHNFRLARAYDDVMPVTNFTLVATVFNL